MSDGGSGIGRNGQADSDGADRRQQHQERQHDEGVGHRGHAAAPLQAHQHGEARQAVHQHHVRVGDVVVMTTVDTPTRLERAVVDQLAQSYRQVVGGPDPQQWSSSLSSLDPCASNVISSPFTSYLFSPKLKLLPNVPRSRDVDIGLVLPYDPPSLSRPEMSEKLEFFGSPEGDEERQLEATLGLTILTSHVLRAKAQHSRHPIPVRKFTLAQYRAAAPTKKDRVIVRRQVAGIQEPVYALQENYISTNNTDPLTVATSALKWVLGRGGYGAS